MLSAIFAGALAVQAPAQADAGSWLNIAVFRVIAPAHIPGQCFVQGRVNRVISGPGPFRAGGDIAITVNCVEGGGGAADEVEGARRPPTIDALRAHKEAMVHVDAGSRVIGNAFIGLGAVSRAIPL